MITLANKFIKRNIAIYMLFYRSITISDKCMNIFFRRAIVLTVFSVNVLFVFSQTKIMIYNGNTTQRENKVFTANLLKSFANSEFECVASDETSNIKSLLKGQGYKKRNNGVIPDSIIASVCEKFEVDYLVNFTLYPQKTTKNVKVSLINANTFSVEKTKIFTCNNLNNKTQVKKTTDEIASFFLLEDLNITPENETDKEDTIVEPNKKDRRGNLNGHYLSLGSSILSPGYYGGLGLAYEYRYRVFGFNASVGLTYGGLTVNGGCKFYLSNRIVFLRNLYFNIAPLCYYGQGSEWISEHYEAGDDYNIIGSTTYKYSPIFGGRILFGYSPVWRVNKKISLGFNMDIGLDIPYKSYHIYDDLTIPLHRRYNYHIYNYPMFPTITWIPITWDLGFIIKLNQNGKENSKKK